MHTLPWFHNRTAKKYLYSYILIGIIPVLIVCLILSCGTGYTLRRRAEDSMRAQLEQLKSDLDSSIACMENNALHFSGILSALPEQADPSHLMEEGWISNQLQVYQESLSVPSEVVYYPRSGTELYTTGGKTSYHSFETAQEWDGQLDMVQFYTKLNTIENRTFLTTIPLGREPDEGYLTYLYPIPAMDVSPRGTIAFLIPRGYFDELVNDYCGSFHGYFLMLDSFYGLSYQVDQCGQHDASLVTKALSLTEGGGDISRTIMDGEAFVFLRTVSKNYGFTYLYAIPERVLYENANKAVIWILGASALLVAILLLLAFQAAANRVKPVLRLADELLPHTGEAAGDLFEQIRLQFQQMELQNNTLQLQLSHQSSMSRYKVLSEILYGWRGDREQLRTAMEQTGILFPYSHFFAIVIQTEQESNSSAFLHAYEQIKTQHDIPCTVYFLDARNSRPAAFLFNTERSEAVREKIAAMLEQALLTEHADFIRIGVGSLHSSPFTANASYCEALVAIQEQAKPISIYQKSAQDDSAFLCPASEGKVLQQSILNGSEEIATDIFRRMTGVITQKHPPLPVARCFCFYIVSLLIQLEPSFESPLPQEELLFAANHADLSLFAFTAETTIRQICREITINRQAADENQSLALLAYIRQNFGDYSICIESLAEHFGMSERTVRQIIKEQTGSGLAAFVTNLRMDFVKKQLAETNIPVRELIEQVGYADVSSFTRKFRQLEGITPGQYRATMRQCQKAE